MSGNKKRMISIVVASMVAVLIFIIIINITKSEKIGFIEGDYSEHKCDYVLCEKSADGGVHNTGYSKSYYCIEHFTKEKNSRKKIQSKSKNNNSQKEIGEGGYEMPNENDKSVTDYIKRVAPDVYDSMEENWNKIEQEYNNEK